MPLQPHETESFLCLLFCFVFKLSLDADTHQFKNGTCSQICISYTFEPKQLVKYVNDLPAFKRNLHVFNIHLSAAGDITNMGQVI